MQTIETFVNLLADTNVDALETFALDHAQAFADLGEFSIEDLKINELSANRIEAQVGEFSIAMFGGQIAPSGSVEELLEVVDGAFAEAQFSQLEILGPDQDLLQFTLTDDGYVFDSGNQSLRVIGDWPASIADFSRTLSALLSIDASDEARRTLDDWIQASGLNEFTLTDQGLPIFAFRSDANTAAISTDSLSITATQGSDGPAKTIALQIAGTSATPNLVMETSGANLADLPYTIPEIVAETGLTLTEQELERFEDLADQTYISFSLIQTLIGTYSFDLNIIVDGYFADLPDPVIEGSPENDMLRGTDAQELFVSGAGDDMIFGGPGTDSARFAGLAGEFEIEVSSDGVVVQDLRSDREGRDVLSGIETLKFDDQFVALGDLEALQNIGPEDITDLVQLYIALYGRLPDAQGLLFWLGVQSAGLTREEIAVQFFDQPEAVARGLDTLAPQHLIQDAYTTVFGRAPDSAGAAFWTEVLSTGEIDRPSFFLALIEGASNSPESSDSAHFADLSRLGFHYALENGLGDVDDAATLVERFNSGQLELDEALDLIVDLAAQALEDPTEISLSISIVTPDFF